MDRRRAMMAGAPQPAAWEDVAFDLSDFANFSSGLHSYDSSAKTLRVYCTSAGTYRGVKKSITLDPLYEYKVDYDLTYVSGTHRSSFAVGSTTQTPNSGKITSSRHVSFIFNKADSYAIDNFRFFCTWDTSTTGDCTISNFSIKRRLL